MQEIPPLGRGEGTDVGDDIWTDDINLEYDPDGFKNLPKKYDYGSKGFVSEVKDQGTCGSCFLFATVAAIESSYMLKHNKKGISLSEMATWNCMMKDGNYQDGTCHKGGNPLFVLYTARKHGIPLEKDGDNYDLSHIDDEPFPVSIW